MLALGIYAQTKTELELRAKLAASEAALANANKDKAALAAIVAKSSSQSTVSAAEAVKSATASSNDLARATREAQASSKIDAGFASQAAQIAAASAKEDLFRIEQSQAASDRTILMIFFTNLFALCGVVAGFIYNAFSDKRKHQWALDEAERREAREVAQVKQGAIIVNGIAALKDETHDTHTLVNSAKGTALRGTALIARKLASETNKPEDLASADEAEREWKEHLQKQTIVDKEQIERLNKPVRPDQEQ